MEPRAALASDRVAQPTSLPALERQRHILLDRQAARAAVERILEYAPDPGGALAGAECG